MYRQLRDSSSLSQRLIILSQNNFLVDIKKQGWHKPQLDEARYLNILYHQYVYTRQVHLYCKQQVFVFARTILAGPCSTIIQKIQQLNKQPLGDLLHNDPSIKRLHCKYTLIQPNSPLSPLPEYKKSLWARRSYFLVNQTPLLLTEIFSPHFEQAIL